MGGDGGDDGRCCWWWCYWVGTYLGLLGFIRFWEFVFSFFPFFLFWFCWVFFSFLNLTQIHFSFAVSELTDFFPACLPACLLMTGMMGSVVSMNDSLHGYLVSNCFHIFQECFIKCLEWPSLWLCCSGFADTSWFWLTLPNQGKGHCVQIHYRVIVA